MIPLFHTVLGINLSESEFRASESDREIDIVVCNDKLIGNSVTVNITAVTVNDANSSQRVAIPTLNPFSPNRAGLTNIISLKILCAP